jgi:hypothetical protein
MAFQTRACIERLHVPVQKVEHDELVRLAFRAREPVDMHVQIARGQSDVRHPQQTLGVGVSKLFDDRAQPARSTPPDRQTVGEVAGRILVAIPERFECPPMEAKSRAERMLEPRGLRAEFAGVPVAQPVDQQALVPLGPAEIVDQAFEPAKRQLPAGIGAPIVAVELLQQRQRGLAVDFEDLLGQVQAERAAVTLDLGLVRVQLHGADGARREPGLDQVRQSRQQFAIQRARLATEAQPQMVRGVRVPQKEPAMHEAGGHPLADQRRHDAREHAIDFGRSGVDLREQPGGARRKQPCPAAVAWAGGMARPFEQIVAHLAQGRACDRHMHFMREAAVGTCDTEVRGRGQQFDQRDVAPTACELDEGIDAQGIVEIDQQLVVAVLQLDQGWQFPADGPRPRRDKAVASGLRRQRGDLLHRRLPGGAGQDTASPPDAWQIHGRRQWSPVPPEA